MERFILQIRDSTFGSFRQEGVGRCASQNMHIVSLMVWISSKRQNSGNKSRPLLVDKEPPIPVGPQHFSAIHVISCRLDAGLCDQSHSTAIRALSFLSSLCVWLFIRLYSIKLKANGLTRPSHSFCSKCTCRSFPSRVAMLTEV